MEETLSVGLEHTGGGGQTGLLGGFSYYSIYIIIIFLVSQLVKLNQIEVLAAEKLATVL